jgi:hypothetical protein
VATKMIRLRSVLGGFLVEDSLGRHGYHWTQTVFPSLFKIDVISALMLMYHSVKKLSRRILERLEFAILEVEE